MKKYVPVLLISLTLLSGCSYWREADFSWMNLFGAEKEEVVKPAMEEVKVNRYLWKAALDKTAFMPKTEQDGESGVIKTGWVSSGSEKYRLDIVINCQELRADGVEVSGYKMTSNGTEVPLSRSMTQAIEQMIVEKARVLYSTSLAN